MAITKNDLITNKHYYVSDRNVVLRKKENGSGAVNHLLLGDWLKYLGNTHDHTYKKRNKTYTDTYAFVRCRGDEGWLNISEFGSERALEVNFVDIGQGDGCHIVTPDDKILLIDAGKIGHMNRFLSWRYNLRGRNVKRAPDFDDSKPVDDPWPIDYVVMSHPDEDHYGGFQEVFENLKLSFSKIYHNGIIERPAPLPIPTTGIPANARKSLYRKDGIEYHTDVGGTFLVDDQRYLYDLVDSTTHLKDISETYPTTSKVLLTTIRALFKNSNGAKFKSLYKKMDALAESNFLDDFKSDTKFSLEILGPIREKISLDGKNIQTLRWFGAKSKDGETKNGHSVIFKGKYGKLSLLLGGDLNDKSQNFLLQSYSAEEKDIKTLDSIIKKISKKPKPWKASDQKKFDDAINAFVRTEAIGKDIFGVDVAKACHHGSQHVLDSFVKSVNASATVISSGDDEGYSHPRADALGAYGKFGYGRRPLIFSTELARSTREFTPRYQQYLALRGITLQIEAETDSKKKKALEKDLQAKKDRNVAVYGMITLRALGDKVIIAQKLERATKPQKKWDIYDLYYDEIEECYTYKSH